MATGKPSWRVSISAACLVLLAGHALGDHGVAAGTVSVRGGLLNVAQSPNALGAAGFAAGRHILMLNGPMTPARRAALVGAGVAVRSYLPTNAFIADVSKSSPARVNALGFVIWAGLYPTEWKVDAALRAGAQGRPFLTEARQALAAQGMAAVDVWLFDDEPAAASRAVIEAIPNAHVTFEEVVAGTARLSVLMPAADAARLADIAGVQFAEHMAEYTPRGNMDTRWIVQTNVPNYTPLYDLGITGVGQIAGLIDFGVIIAHCSFNDPLHAVGPLHRKVLSYDAPFANDTHGTHCAGTLLGDGGLPNSTRGVAYGARLVFSQYPQATEMSQYAKHLAAYDLGARVHSNSWGDDSTTAYDSACRGIDAFQFDHDDDLIFFSVTDRSGPVRNPENAKNPMAVTASGSVGFQDQWCVGGGAPTADGRRKPDIAAPGCGIESSNGFECGVLSLTGTSMACPAAAGAGVLVRQYFTDGFYPTGAAVAANAIVPSGPLLKAVLINSASDITMEPGYPSAREGWGRVTAANDLGFAADRRKMLLRDARNMSAGALTTGGTSELRFYVGTCPSTLRVTLAYHDAPALANAAFAPVNDLDLVVTSPAGAVYRGNVISGGVSMMGGVADAINNVENVLLPGAATGWWTATVLGTAVNIGQQGFALVVSGPVDEAECGTADFDCDGDVGTDADIEAFFAALAGNGAGDADIDRDGDVGTDADIEAFFRILAGQAC